MPIIDLWNKWNDTERKEAISAMGLVRKIELTSALLSAGFTASALLSAGFSASEVRSAGFSASALRSAGFSASEVLSAGFTASEVPEKFSADIKEKARKMGREESEFVVYQLKMGLMNGSAYGSIKECGCLLGSAAKKAGMSVESYCSLRGIKKDGSSPAEQWFLAVSVGDTPENNYAAEMGVKWIEEVLAESK